MSARGVSLDQLMGLDHGSWTFRPRRRVRLAFVIALGVTLLAAGATVGHEQVAEAAGAVCTVGEPAGTTCTEALVRVGYP